jgi:hypothetical protein
MQKPHAPQSLARILAADGTLSAWNARRERELAVLRVVRRALPRPVAERVFVADCDGPELRLATAAGAIATVVRQRTPEILELLAQHGWQFSGLRVRVQPRAETVPAQKKLPRQWDNSSHQAVSRLAAGLSPGPLREALERLLRRG